MCRARVYGLSWQPYQIIQGCLHILLYVSPGQRVVTLLWQNSTFSSLIIPQLSLIWCIVDHTNTIGFLLLFFLILSYISFFFLSKNKYVDNGVEQFSRGLNMKISSWYYVYAHCAAPNGLCIQIMEALCHIYGFCHSNTWSLFAEKLNECLIINVVICDVEPIIRKN